MKERMTIEDLLRAKNLSKEELELHKDLISECRERERRIEECAAETRENLERLSDALTAVSKRTIILGEALSELLEEAETLYLRNLPEEKFYRE